MQPGSERQRAQLAIPTSKVPKFPFSSPITEEIGSPISSSSEDREMERNRPFEFLVKMSGEKAPAHKAASNRAREVEPNLLHTAEGRGGSGLSSFTARKNPERPVGLNLDIPSSTPQPRKETTGAFVDLNDLKVLSKAREEERTAQKVKGILKKGDTRGFQRLPDDPSDSSGGRKRRSLLDAFPKSPKKKARDDGVSPTDRPIVIGYSVPYDSPEFQDEKSKELDSAGTQQTPLTPSIIVTPAEEDGFWRHLSPENTRPRAASSVYSQPSPNLGPYQSDVPPVPALPALYSNGGESKISDSRIGLSVNSVRKDHQPTGRSRSHSNEKISERSSRLTISTALNGRASQGWWNYILSPLLSRTSTLLSRTTPTETRPPLPTIATNSTGLSDEWWEEKERSYFSPDTPEATEATRRLSSMQRTNGNPFADFDWSIDEQQTQSPKGGDKGVASMMFSGQRIQGAAAEYYQACAHELFSGTPYFECIDHLCSITPKHKVPVVAASPTIQEIQTEKGLLIDVDDMPQSNNLESPRSGITSINSSPSDEASIISRELRTSPKSSRAALSEKTPGAPEISSPVLDTGARQLELSSEAQNESQSTNPFLQQSREILVPASTHIQPPAHYPPPNIHIESAPAPQPANIYIQVPAPQAPPNVHFQAPTPPAPFAAPAAPEVPNVPEATEPQSAPMGPIVRTAPTEPEAPAPAVRTAPPPISMPSPEQIPPPSYGVQPPSPYPRSPESLQDSTERGAIRLSNMPAGPAPAYTAHDNAAELPPRTRAAPIAREDLAHPVTERDRIENRRRRYEREDAVGRRAGGWWRGRGPFSNKGCFGRTGREGRLRRRWYLAIFLLFISIVVGAVLLAIFLTRKGDGTPVQSQWLNLTGYPPMPTGISTIAGPEARVQDSGCIIPSSMWSCALPKEQQPANEPYAPNQPNFRVEIRFQNGTYDRSTAVAPRSLQLLSRSANQLFNPSPSPPSTNDQKFLGKTTDKNSEPYDGEETPFYITVLSAEHLSSSQLSKRDNSSNSHFPDVGSLIPSPAVDSDGSAAPAVLYPFPSSQPVRLYNRDKDDEHYGFYTYFDKSIFLSSDTAVTGRKDNSANDTNGGSTKADARVRCTFAQTRFLVQIWTKPERSGKTLFSRSASNSTESDSDSASATETTAATASPTSSATDFTRPGSFPYPVTITLDRHGGIPTEKMVYCYGMESDQHINGTEKKFQVEDRAFGGEVINPAPGIFNLTGSGDDDDNDNGDDGDNGEEYGGYDGGTGGCSCQWVNWAGSV
ncbi:uncharacterized protein BJX67DRAFT_318627 [Aspergillus lucknowensis]|uniref:Glycoprotease family protein n=1 Tax=Aspergillus lucknowensis TaxID=176173 RepID=A0ABR4L905_9EURO